MNGYIEFYMNKDGLQIISIFHIYMDTGILSVVPYLKQENYLLVKKRLEK